MDPATPVNVAKGAAITSIAVGTLTAIHAVFRGLPHPTSLALSAASNGGIAGAIFFGTREVVVSPLLRATWYHNAYDQVASASKDAVGQPSWSQLRMHRMLDSTVSGALTGVIINKWRNGRIWAGARTAGLICALLQLGYNELGVMRIKYVSRKVQETRSQPEAVTAPSPTRLEDNAKPKVSFFDRAMNIIGFRKLSDEEYLRVLKKQRNEALERIAILESERAERQQTDEHTGTSSVNSA
ncbi:hypothetical protein BD414DRAFT_313659 [Trametes punicea]|nr:hypothetical protein BD414DRAFT_313659 [Trametes punicea]